METEEKLKNLKDLEYGRLLNLENILLASIGALIIAIMLAEKLPGNLGKIKMVSLLTLVGVAVYFHFNKRLNKISQEIISL